MLIKCVKNNKRIYALKVLVYYEAKTRLILRNVIVSRKWSKVTLACCASLHIHNVLTKGVQHKSMVKLYIKGDGCTSWSIHSSESSLPTPDYMNIRTARNRAIGFRLKCLFVFNVNDFYKTPGSVVSLTFTDSDCILVSDVSNLYKTPWTRVPVVSLSLAGCICMLCFNINDFHETCGLVTCLTLYEYVSAMSVTSPKHP